MFFREKVLNLLLYFLDGERKRLKKIRAKGLVKAGN